MVGQALRAGGRTCNTRPTTCGQCPAFDGCAHSCDPNSRIAAPPPLDPTSPQVDSGRLRSALSLPLDPTRESSLRASFEKIDRPQIFLRSKRLAFVRSPIDVFSMADGNDQHKKPCVMYLVNHAVATGPNAPSGTTRKLFTARRSGVICKPADCRNNLRLLRRFYLCELF